ncbi:MAG: succinate--CoA ligase subunit beta [Elusimicrobia bacterium RIFCSPHIGHO2_02_FULL_57_9]|nr:MAG: succinate--CoA ligase subunit beta [Elusimicrobia bacterium RIFCSPHIGHO2_02_FULL_57_9]
MKLLEYEAKDLLRGAGIPVASSGGVIKDGKGLPAALKKAGQGPWMIKAQVLAGGRGKAGGIKLVKTPAQAKTVAKSILGMNLATHQTRGQGIKVKEVLVEAAAKIVRELYFSVVLDRKIGLPTIIASAQGGVEIEKLAEDSPQAVIRQPFSPQAGLLDFEARQLAFALNIAPDRLSQFCRIAKGLARLFLDYDCSLLEVNPLALTPKGMLALDAKVIIDDNAMFRHPDLAKLPDHEASPLEKEAKKADISYIGLDGTIGCMVNGAGLAMGTMDTIQLAGGSPANFLDVGGGADGERVTKAFKIILRDKKVKAVLVNIFGGIVKCDMIAAGILGALKKVKLKVPLVVRLQGTNVEKGREILSNSGIGLVAAQDLWEAAQKVVSAAGAKR